MSHPGVGAFRRCRVLAAPGLGAILWGMPREFIAHEAKLPKRAPAAQQPATRMAGAPAARPAGTATPLSQAAAQPGTPQPDAGQGRTREIGGPEGPEPTRYGDWERKGICVDF